MVDKKALVERYIQLDPQRAGPAEARIRGFGVHVWALAGYFKVVGDIGRVAEDYELPGEAVEAAISFYDEHKAAIDARLAANTITNAA